uniref:Huntingtin interacting protein 1 n=1 Tax=Poecilia latipinna TaxID=48699 RepID=A0A3B3U7P2_9TELE
EEANKAVSINKAINTQEVAVKEKHKGAHTFWAAVNRLPLSSNAVLCWKFCHVFHKLLRDGHPNVIKDSMRNKADLADMSRMWGHLSEGYGKLCSIYLKLLITKMEFHIKVSRPANKTDAEIPSDLFCGPFVALLSHLRFMSAEAAERIKNRLREVTGRANSTSSHKR